jgi:hypothetical protein
VVLEVAGRPVVLTGTDDGHLRRDRYDLVRGRVDGFGIGVTHTPERRLLRDFAADGHALVLPATPTAASCGSPDTAPW